MNSLLKRTLSGIVFVAVIVWATLFSTWSFYAIWSLVAILSLVEYNGLLSKHPVENMNRGWLRVVGIVYILISMLTVMSLDSVFVLTFITIVWANDTGAYLVGSAIGKHKMFPNVSPKKSWEGFFGGLLFAVGVALVWYALYWSKIGINTGIEIFGAESFDSTVEKLKWLLFGLLVGVAAVAGDLVESKFKRTLGVKDSGNLIPGHGGMLDRFDATFMAAFVAGVFSYVLEIF